MAKQENKNTTKKRGTKAAIVASFAALLLCGATLVGTTFAWFTDTASTASNSIQAGNLGIKLSVAGRGEDGKVEVDETTGKVSNWIDVESTEGAAITLFDSQLWEPDHVRYELLRIENAGNLALKWKARISIDTEELAKWDEDKQLQAKALASVMQVYLLDPTKEAEKIPVPTDRNTITQGTNLNNVVELRDGVTTLPQDVKWTQPAGATNLAQVLGEDMSQEFDASCNLLAGKGKSGTYTISKDGTSPAEAYYAPDSYQLGIALGIDGPSVQNTVSFGGQEVDLHGASIPGLKIEILATQGSLEEDSFSIEYDRNATFDGTSSITTGS